MSPTSVQLAVLTGLVAVVGLLLLAAYAWQEGTLKILAVGALASLGASGIAAVGGFLFGLPRYNPVLAVPVTGSQSQAESSVTAAAQSQAAAGIYTPSNNLEQVSDWLTKLLLGAGLVQLGRVGRWLGGFINGLARGLTSGGTDAALPAAKVVAGSLVAFYTAFGFLFGYIITTLWYRRRLEAATQALLHPP